MITEIIKNKFYTKGQVDKWYFTSDEHYGHDNVIKYCNRPFKNVNEMNCVLIENHNSVVNKNDVTIHVGDFTLKGWAYALNIIEQLNGRHIFIEGSHDYWLNKIDKKLKFQIYQRKFNDIFIVLCHYAMHNWHRSHYGSWHLYGHAHNSLQLEGNRFDCGVDTNNFFPYSLDDIKLKMEEKNGNI